MRKPTVLAVVIVVIVVVAFLVWSYKQRLPHGVAKPSPESGEITAELRRTLPAELFPTTGVQWIPNALSAGEEFLEHDPGRPRTLYVCRAAHGSGVHPGKLVGGACNIGFGGDELEKRQYEVAAYVGGSWGNHGLGGALLGGYEAGRKLYVCRHHLTETLWPCPWCKNDYGWHAGKFLPDTGECNFGYGGRELSDDEDNEFFYP
jgi:hypothetical protein